MLLSWVVLVIDRSDYTALCFAALLQVWSWWPVAVAS